MVRSGIMADMKSGWQLPNLIDLEYLFHLDRDSDHAELHHRDRQIFLDLENGSLIEGQAESKRVLLLWVKKRLETVRSPNSRMASPGHIYAGELQLARQVSWVLGAFIGILAGIGFFSYSGTTPINVFHFLLIFIASQLVLVAVFLARRLLQSLLCRSSSTLAVTFSRYLMTRLVGWLIVAIRNRLQQRERLAAEHAFGLTKSYSTQYGGLFFWPLAGLVQLFGIGFNLGLLAITTLKIVATDLAFGWQSTLQLSTESVFSLVKILALPWSWLFGAGIGFPTLDQIRGSHIILKDGIYHLATGDLTAWWPFLIGCLFVYGFLVRFCLYLGSNALGRYRLKQFRFDSPECLAVIRRMNTPVVRSQAAAQSQPAPGSPTANAIIAESSTPIRQLETLIPDDIFALCEKHLLDRLFQPQLLTVGTCHRFLHDFESDERLLYELQKKDWQEEEGIIVVMEGWMPPLLDFLSYLRALRNVIGPNRIIYLALTGQPKNDGFAVLPSSSLEIWRQKIGSLGDPYLKVFSLIGEDK